MRNLPAFGCVAVKFNLIAVGIIDPGLPGLISAQLGFGDFQTCGAQFGNSLSDIIDFQADVCVALVIRASGGLTLKKFNEGAGARL